MQLTHQEQAEQNFLAGYNCAQSVLLAFSGDLGLTPDVALTAPRPPTTPWSRSWRAGSAGPAAPSSAGSCWAGQGQSPPFRKNERKPTILSVPAPGL